MRAIHVVRSPPSDHACSELLAAQPTWPTVVGLRMDAFFGVDTLPASILANVVIQIFGDGHFGFNRPRGIAGQSDLDGLELSDASIAY